MAPLPRRRLTGTTLGWALALLAGLLCAPAARASCGSHLRLLARPDALATTHAGAGASRGEHARLPADHLPGHCSGPMCSSGSPAPAAPPPTAPELAEQWGDLLSRPDPTTPHLPDYVPLDEGGSATHLPGIVYRPPRHV